MKSEPTDDTGWPIYKCILKVFHFIAIFLRQFNRLRNGCIHLIQRQFRHVGDIVTRHHRLCIILCIISVCLAAVSMYSNDIKLSDKLQKAFIPSNSFATYEQMVKDEFENQRNEMHRFTVLINKENGENMLSKKEVNTVLEILAYIRTNITLIVDGRKFNYQQLCGECKDNGVLEDLLPTAMDDVLKGGPTTSFVGHPQSKVFGMPFLVAHHIFGIHRIDQNVSIHRCGNSTEGELCVPSNFESKWPRNSSNTDIDRISMISLYFTSPIVDKWMKKAVAEWEIAVFRWCRTQTEFPTYNLHPMGDAILNGDVVQGAFELVPFFIYGFILDLFYISFSTCIWVYRQGQFHCTVVFIGFLKMLGPFFSVLITTGLMSLFGIAIFPPHFVLPFLVLAIGVDDAYIMHSEWRRGAMRVQMKQRLLGETLSVAGPSILITSLTNSAAFAVGAIGSSTAMQTFCLTAALMIAIDFVLQIVFFGPILIVLVGEKVSPVKLAEKPKSSAFFKKYSNILLKKWTRICLLILYCLLTALAAYQTLTMETRIDSSQVIPSTSPLLESDALIKKYYWMEYEPIFIYINGVGDLENPTVAEDLRNLITDIESMPTAIGRNSTVLWIDYYDKTWRHRNLYEKPLSLTNLPNFLDSLGTKFFETQIHWKQNNGSNAVNSFSLSTGLHNGTSWMQRTQTMIKWREILAQHSEVNATVWSENSDVFEGILNLPFLVRASTFISALAMLGICFILIPSVVGCLIAVSSILSICLEVVGALSISGLDLDPISMTAIVMAVGFSVDYTAHVIYHYAENAGTGCSCSENLQHSLESVMWNTTNAAISTVCMFIPAILHDEHITRVFVVSVLAVVTSGCLHALVFLPCALAAVPQSWFPSDPKIEEEEISEDVINVGETSSIDMKRSDISALKTDQEVALLSKEAC